MSSVERRFQFVVDEDVARDLEDMMEQDPDEAAIAIALIEEMTGNARLCAMLVDETLDDEDLDVEPFWALQTKKYNAFRVRHVEVANWRFITASDWKSNRIALLYIMRRDEDYDDEVQRRCIAAFEKLGFWIRGT